MSPRASASVSPSSGVILFTVAPVLIPAFSIAVAKSKFFHLFTEES
jgi:hypothetical protein